MQLDAHQHFWNFTDNPGDFAWMTAEYSVLGRNFLPADLEPLLRANDIDGCIAVQAREMSKETGFLLELAEQHSFIRGVVGWADLCDPNVGAGLERYADNPLLKGFRMLVHDREDIEFAASSDHARGVGMLANYNWTYDLLLRTIHLPAAQRLVDRFPNQSFVIDHIAKPRFDGSDWNIWLTDMQAIAERPNVMCKLSGLVTETDWSQWQSVDYARYLDAVINAFGANRCMFGSDWPVSTCATDYTSSRAVVTDWAGKLSETEQSAIFGGTCAHFYNVAA
ncbi:MAG: amidohydrolase family protein [Gammaproteobacteria bacterium]|nr:amidohydrolase family protein [Gammaproteobacteria bacterium]